MSDQIKRLRMAIIALTDDKAEQVAADLDHGNRAHVEWYRSVKRGRRLLDQLERECLEEEDAVSELGTEAEVLKSQQEADIVLIRKYKELSEALEAEKNHLRAELAYVRLQRDALLRITWLDLPDEPHESTARWQEQFEKGWERKCISEELHSELSSLREQNAALLKDKARLEYILKFAKAPDWKRDWPQGWRIDLWLNVSNHEGNEPTVIEAIDGAIAHSKEGT